MPQSTKRKFLKYTRLFTIIVIFGFFLLAISVVLFKLMPIFRFCRTNNLTSGFLLQLLSDSDPLIRKYQDRTNIVLLGIGDESHEGQDLTDTVIFLSIDFNSKDTLMVSIPRDIWLPSLKDRINTAYHYGEGKQKGGGILMAKSAIEEVVGVPIHYALLVNFSGFKKLIDLAGGVDVEVSQEFTDDQYPIEGKENDFCKGDPTFACRFEVLHFTKGWQHMDGEKALKYTRSRYSAGEEGTDFARSKRQQQVLIALKDKLIQSKFWFNPELISDLFNTYNQITTTDMNWSEQIVLGKFFLLVSNGKIRKLTLDTGDEEKGTKGLLVNPPLWQYDGAWVLIPRSGDFSEINKHISCFLQDPSCQLKP